MIQHKNEINNFYAPNTSWRGGTFGKFFVFINIQ